MNNHNDKCQIYLSCVNLSILEISQMNNDKYNQEIDNLKNSYSQIKEYVYDYNFFYENYALINSDDLEFNSKIPEMIFYPKALINKLDIILTGLETLKERISGNNIKLEFIE